MRTLTKEEMKAIGGARPGGTCLPGSSCRGGECCTKVLFGGLEYWLPDGTSC